MRCNGTRNTLPACLVCVAVLFTAADVRAQGAPSPQGAPAYTVEGALRDSYLAEALKMLAGPEWPTRTARVSPTSAAQDALNEAYAVVAEAGVRGIRHLLDARYRARPAQVLSDYAWYIRSPIARTLAERIISPELTRAALVQAEDVLARPLPYAFGKEGSWKWWSSACYRAASITDDPAKQRDCRELFLQFGYGPYTSSKAAALGFLMRRYEEGGKRYAEAWQEVLLQERAYYTALPRVIHR